MEAMADVHSPQAAFRGAVVCGDGWGVDGPPTHPDAVSPLAIPILMS